MAALIHSERDKFFPLPYGHSQGVSIGEAQGMRSCPGFLPGGFHFLGSTW